MAIDFLKVSQEEVKNHIISQMDAAAQKKDLSYAQQAKLYAVKKKAPGDIAEAFVKVRDRHATDLEKVKNGTISASAYADIIAKDFQQTLQSDYSVSLGLLTAMVNNGKKEGETPSSNLDVAMALAGTGKEIPELHPIKQMAHDAAKVFEKKKEVTPPEAHTTSAPQQDANKPPKDSTGKPTKPASAQPSSTAAAGAPKPVNKPQAGAQTPPASSTTTPPPVSSATTPPPPPAKTQSEFEKSYEQMAMGGVMISGALDAAKADPKNASAAKSGIVDDIKKGIIAKLEPELTKRGIEHSAADVARLAEVAGNAMYDYMQKQKDSGLKEGSIPSLPILDAHSDGMAKYVREALGKENLGQLSDDKYLDVIVGMSASGKAQDRYGASLHGLGSAMIAHAFGTDKVKDDHKQQMALDTASSALRGKGSQLDIGTLEGAADTTLGSIYGVGTNKKVKDIIQKSFRGEDSGMEFGDVTKAWNEMGEKDMGGGMMTRFFMFLDALLYKFTGLSFIGATTNPMIAMAEENANERRVTNTYETIMATSPSELGVNNEQERLQLAERVTGLRKTGGEPAFAHIGTDGKVGGYSGLFATAMGLRADGTAPDSDIKPHTISTETATNTPPPTVTIKLLAEDTPLRPDQLKTLNTAIGDLRLKYTGAASDAESKQTFNALVGNHNLLGTGNHVPELNQLAKNIATKSLEDGKITTQELDIITKFNEALKTSGLNESVIPITSEGEYGRNPTIGTSFSSQRPATSR